MYPSCAAEHLDVKGIPHELVVDYGEGVARCHGKEENARREGGWVVCQGMEPGHQLDTPTQINSLQFCSVDK